MKKVLVLVALLALVAMPSFAQTATTTGAYLVDYFTHNNIANYDQSINLVNYGATGTPLTSPAGDVCANIYVFDANQEMVECCSCRITPNGLLTLGVKTDLTLHPLTSVVPASGDVKIVSTAAAGSCSALTYNGGILDSIVGFGTHLQTGGSPAAAYITETNLPPATLSAAENAFLTNACSYVIYLGSGVGQCNCPLVAS